MQRKHVNILLAVAGTIVVICVVLVAAGVWFASSMFHEQDADEQTAAAAMEAVRTRFTGATPVFELRPGGPVLTRPVPASAPPGMLRTMHALMWDPRDQSLARYELPFALLRLKEGPIELGSAMGGAFPMEKGTVRVRDIEQFGPSLLFDQDTPDGGHALIWTE
jgi:hypothetical protein